MMALMNDMEASQCDFKAIRSDLNPFQCHLNPIMSD